MKYKGHIKTGNFEFIEIKSDDRDELIQEYHSIKSEFKDKEGLPLKEWNSALDRYLTSNDLDAEVYENMSREQKDIIQEIKRSLARIKSKLNK